MKDLFINGTISFVTKYNKYTDEQIEKMKYGIEGIYLTVVKLIVIVLLVMILKMTKELLLLLLFFNIIRYFGFGIHAKKSSECLISSIILFVILPYLFIKTNINYYVLITLSIISLISFIPFAPADTPKRPFKNKKKKMVRKIITIAIGIIYLISSFLVKSMILKKVLLLSIIIQGIVINPLTYKILKQPYNSGKSAD